jgi:DNA (cytosine-5)-methyltransferase 1
MGKIPVIDLFAGAGGLSVAARRAGAELLASVELDDVCCRTLRANARWHGGEVLNADVAELKGAKLRRDLGLAKSDPLVVVGGAPCQPFSKAAYWVDPGADAAYRRARARGERLEKPALPPVRSDVRRDLVEEFWRLVRESGAVGFVFENVPSLLHPRNKAELLKLQRSAEANGFSTTLQLANAAAFGVAQKRSRVFLLGSKYGAPAPVTATHSLSDEVSTRRLRACVGVGEVLAPFAGSEFHEPEEVVSGRWADHLRDVPPGWNYKAHTAWAGHPEPTFVTETRFWNFLLKLDPDQPSWTIAANPGPWTGPFHWTNRRLRTPELAAVQDFPKGYAFAGTRRERVRQIGNAVPPGLAAPMIRSVLRTVVDGSLKRRTSAVA